MSEATFSSKAGIKVINDSQLGLYHWYKHHLSNTFCRLNNKRGWTSIPTGYHELALVVWIDKAYQIT